MDGAQNRSRPWILTLVMTCVALTSLCGMLKLELQKAHPPRYAEITGQVFDGYVSIDWYSHRAERLRLAMLGERDGGLEILLEQRDTLHPSAWLVPALVALLSLVTQSIPLAFAMLSLLAMGAGAWLVALLTRAAGSEGRVAACAAAAYLAHVTVVRTSAQFYIDPFLVVASLAACALSLELARGAWRVGPALALFAVQAAGLFLKSSYLPMLAAPALVQLLLGREARVGAALRAAALFGALPLAPVLVFLLTVYGGLGSGAEDMSHLSSVWRLDGAQLEVFAREMLLLFQWIPLALAFGRPWRAAIPRAILVVAALFLLSVWAFGLPAIGRLYLPAVALLIAATYAGLARECSFARVALLTVGHAALNYALATYILASHA